MSFPIFPPRSDDHSPGALSGQWCILHRGQGYGVYAYDQSNSEIEANTPIRLSRLEAHFDNDPTEPCIVQLQFQRPIQRALPSSVQLINGVTIAGATAVLNTASSEPATDIATFDMRPTMSSGLPQRGISPTVALRVYDATGVYDPDRACTVRAVFKW